MFGMCDYATEIVQLLLHQQNPLLLFYMFRNAHRRCVGAMSGAERIVDI